MNPFIGPQSAEIYVAEMDIRMELTANLANTSAGDWIEKLHLIYCDHRVKYKNHVKSIVFLHLSEKNRPFQK